jgi:4-amino-4-deoxy-L-arabinose transferase-like glycosyltransferase
MRWAERLTRPTEGRWLLWLVLLALCTRLLWAGAMRDREPRFDEVGYFRHAVELCESQRYVDSEGRPSDYQPVGFPLALAGAVCLLGRHASAGFALQITIGVLICLLVSSLGERTFGRLEGRIAGLVMAIYPTQVFYGTLLLTEPLVTLLLLAATAALLWSLRASPVWAFSAGLCLGFAILTRPVFALFPCVIPLWYARNGQTLRRAAWRILLVAGGVALVVGPWMIRNHRVFGVWGDLSSTGGQNFLMGNNPDALGGYKHDADRLRAQVRHDGTVDWSQGYRLGWQTIRAAPGAAALRAVQKVSYLFALETDGVLWNLKGKPSRVPLAAALALLTLANLGYLAIACTCLLALLIPGRERRMTSLFWMLTAYVLLMSVLFVGDPRYHFPLVPFAALVASGTLLDGAPKLLAAFRAGDPAARRRLAVWLMLIALLGLLLVGNLRLKQLEVQRFGPLTESSGAASPSSWSAGRPVQD